MTRRPLRRAALAAALLAVFVAPAAFGARPVGSAAAGPVPVRLRAEAVVTPLAALAPRPVDDTRAPVKALRLLAVLAAAAGLLLAGSAVLEHQRALRTPTVWASARSARGPPLTA